MPGIWEAASPSKDVEFTQDLLDSIYNSELADTYGNLARRVGVLAQKKLQGHVTGGRLDPSLEQAIERAIDPSSEDDIAVGRIMMAWSRCLDHLGGQLGRLSNTYIPSRLVIVTLGARKLE